MREPEKSLARFETHGLRAVFVAPGSSRLTIRRVYLAPSSVISRPRGSRLLAAANNSWRTAPSKKDPYANRARPVQADDLEVAWLQPLDSADRFVDDVNAPHRPDRDAYVAMHGHDALARGQLEDDLIAVARNVRHGQFPDSGGVPGSARGFDSRRFRGGLSRVETRCERAIDEEHGFA